MISVGGRSEADGITLQSTLNPIAVGARSTRGGTMISVGGRSEADRITLQSNPNPIAVSQGELRSKKGQAGPARSLPA
ncbi:hypothetical protein [Zhongshania aliphaticivorans]|uniref:hypothetical protein n=1 Tax=Zhongshania aliphaticivorans TaxID=1470434 RepID=UPI00132FE125|nr:hypothetical protein [Zhongshania aliphaticivorans]